MQGNESDGIVPLFVLATRLYVRYKFRMRRDFDPQRALVDDPYAREVLAMVRGARDAQLLQMADRFELARFGALASPPEAAPGGPVFDLQLDNPA